MWHARPSARPMSLPPSCPAALPHGERPHARQIAMLSPKQPRYRPCQTAADSLLFAPGFSEIKRARHAPMVRTGRHVVMMGAPNHVTAPHGRTLVVPRDRRTMPRDNETKARANPCRMSSLPLFASPSRNAKLGLHFTSQIF